MPCASLHDVRPQAARLSPLSVYHKIICLLIFIFPVFIMFQSPASHRTNVILLTGQQGHCYGCKSSSRKDWFPFVGTRGPSSALFPRGYELLLEKSKTQNTGCKDLKDESGLCDGSGSSQPITTPNLQKATRRLKMHWSNLYLDETRHLQWLQGSSDRMC